MRNAARALVLSALIYGNALYGQESRVDDVAFAEFSASATTGGGAVELTGKLLLPNGERPLRGVFVVLNYGIGSALYDDAAWRQLAADIGSGMLLVSVKSTVQKANTPIAEQPIRNAALGGADGILQLLDTFASQSERPELEDAGLVLWGHSAAGSFAATFAALHPNRTIAFIRYHSHSRGLPLDLSSVKSIPALAFAGGEDATAGVEDTKEFWRAGRELAAPWTFVVEPGVPHGSWESLAKANELAIPWIRAVCRQRITDDDLNQRSVDGISHWLASYSNREVAPAASFEGAKAEASWLPDEASAEGWLSVAGL